MLLPATDGDVFLPDVALRPGVTVDLHLAVFVNEARQPASCASENVVLAVPGFAHTAATWQPYAFERFADPAQHACAVIVVDMPGHGLSGLPEGITFGELTLDDYATALLAVLGSFADSPAAPSILIGHSQGGIVIQMAQQRLVTSGSSLRLAGIREVQLLAPAPPAGLPWSFVDSGAAGQLLGALLVLDDPVLGPHASVPPALWPALFFSNLSGQVAPGAPTPAQVAANGYNAPAPLYASLQLVGAPPFARPSISPGIFAGRYGTRLGVVVFDQDPLIRPEEGRALMQLLTDGQSARTFTVIPGEFAVHDLYLSDPAAILRPQPPTPQ
ncbi:MAG TPA: alpha/beta hydrolase [Longimicrobium sp.]|nr:alpha/beta hydrolase [Longimicrobium sp.]